MLSNKRCGKEEWLKLWDVSSQEIIMFDGALEMAEHQSASCQWEVVKDFLILLFSAFAITII